MRAVVYRKPFDVGVEEVPDPGIEHPNDVIVRITSTCICGSDLWPYRGEDDSEHQVSGCHNSEHVGESHARHADVRRTA